MNIYEKLTAVQNELKAPKSKYNSFGKYNYRSCEDILEAVKPLLAKNKLAMTIKDEIENIGDRFYVAAIVTVFDCESEQTIQTRAFAREDTDKKGMDGSQITGSSSSYARKYALNGMFAIDDTKDADSWNTHDKVEKTENKPKTEYATEEQVSRLNELYKDSPDAYKKALTKLGVTNAVMLKKLDAQALIDRVEAALAKANANK